MLTDLTDIDKTAQAKVGAETWTVKSDKAPLLKGTKVKVLAIEGVKAHSRTRNRMRGK